MNEPRKVMAGDDVGLSKTNQKWQQTKIVGIDSFRKEEWGVEGIPIFLCFRYGSQCFL